MRNLETVIEEEEVEVQDELGPAKITVVELPSLPGKALIVDQEMTVNEVEVLPGADLIVEEIKVMPK